MQEIHFRGDEDDGEVVTPCCSAPVDENGVCTSCKQLIVEEV